MQYIGGKEKSGAAQIANLVNIVATRRKITQIAEPFCGGLSVTCRLKVPNLIASDACQALITLYNNFRGDWDPPQTITREQWEHYKRHPDPLDPLTAFIGFGCSVLGIWFSGFSERSKRTGDNYVPAARAAYESLDRKLAKCPRTTTFVHGDYRQVADADLNYYDPPYAGTLAYGAVEEPFDSEEMWQWVREKSQSNLYLVSERCAPKDFVAVLTFDLQNRISTKSEKGRRVEYAFVHETQLQEWTVVRSKDL